MNNQTPEKYYCPLCYWDSWEFYSEQFRKCNWCTSIFRCSKYFISPEKEKLRYQEHNNDIENKKYQAFVSPIVDTIIQNHKPTEIWLDFWAGTGPVISHMLWKKWFSTKLYDPFFHNNPKLLENRYDFIIACEVVEHFHNPRKEFELLYNLLKPWGKLYIMTDLYSQEVDFHNWYYKNDKTHVFFYSDAAFKYIEKNWNWSSYQRQWRCIIFEK